MSIPRFAIHRPVTMFMISAVIVLLGSIALLKLPVDLMPDVSFPSLTVRVSRAGVRWACDLLRSRWGYS